MPDTNTDRWLCHAHHTNRLSLDVDCRDGRCGGGRKKVSAPDMCRCGHTLSAHHCYLGGGKWGDCDIEKCNGLCEPVKRPEVPNG